MNRTLLLVICDFLLLNLLALTRWDRTALASAQKPPVPAISANMAAPQNQDLVEAMKLTLEEERATRDRLQERLQSAESDAAAHAQKLERIAAQKSELETNLDQARQKAAELAQHVAAASRRAAQTQEKVERLEQSLVAHQAELEKQKETLAAQARRDALEEELQKQLQQALAEKEAEIERQRQALADAEGERNAALRQVSRFAADVQVAEKERDLLRENVGDLKGEVAIVRQEKERLHARTTELAGGVTQLAAKTGELAEEIRGNTPVNMNLLFDEFLSNRVEVTVAALGRGLFGPALRQKVSQTVLIRKGTNLFAPLHVSETPFSLMIPATGMSIVSATVAQSGRELTKSPIHFWATDCRVVLVPVPEGVPARVKTYETSRNPFKFTEAVLISRGGRYYGEVEFKLDPRSPNYVRMKNRLFSRLFGEFSPSVGDLVLSKTGEFLGLMVNSDYCAVMKDFDSAPDDRFDERTLAEEMRYKLERFRTRIDRLPSNLQ